MASESQHRLSWLAPLSSPWWWHRDRSCASSVLDRIDSLSRHANSHPAPSRANYILSPQWGLNYFIVPYGALILALPFIFLRGSWLFGFVPCCLVSGWHFWWDSAAQRRWAIFAGTCIRRAHHGAIQLLGNFARAPVCGTSGPELVDRYRMWAVVGLTTLAAFSCALAVGWATYRPADAEDFKVDRLPRGSIVTATISIATSPWDSATRLRAWP
jgi:hypothetical protein